MIRRLVWRKIGDDVVGAGGLGSNWLVHGARCQVGYSASVGAGGWRVVGLFLVRWWRGGYGASVGGGRLGVIE